MFAVTAFFTSGGKEIELRANANSPVQVAILSDTHGFLDPRIAKAVCGCDIAVHAGDVGNAAVLRELAPRSKMILAVLGNNDTRDKWPARELPALGRLPSEAALELPGGKLIVTHGDRHGATKKRHAQLRQNYPDARAIVYGHSHRLVCDQEQNPWLLNPGAAGRSRTFGGPSFLILTAGKKNWRLRAFQFHSAGKATGWKTGKPVTSRGF